MSMKKVAVASNNKHKIEEIRAILSGIYGDAIEVKSLSDIGFREISSRTGTPLKKMPR